MDVRFGIFVCRHICLSHRTRKSRSRDLFRRMASGSFALARPVNRTILLSQKQAATRRPSCSPKKNTLTDSQKRLGRAPGYANVVWAPDSKRFAFNLQPGKGFQTTQFYQLDGNTWRKLDPPEAHAATTAPLDCSMTNQKKKVKKKLKLSADDWGWPRMTSWQVRRWIDSSTVLLYAHRSAEFDLKNDTEEVNVSFFFTLKFDHAGNWKVTRKFEVPEKGVGGLDAEERKEINRIEDEDRELRGK